MSRYIKDTDIEEQYQSLKVQKYGDVDAIISKEEIVTLTLMAIDSCPTSDAVVVVRCKDCKHYHVYRGTLPKTKHPWDCGACDAWDNLTTDENGFCFRGERKEE